MLQNKLSKVRAGVRPLIPSLDLDASFIDYCQGKGGDVIAKTSLFGMQNNLVWKSTSYSDALSAVDLDAVFTTQNTMIYLVDSLGNADSAYVTIGLVDDAPEQFVSPIWVDKSYDLLELGSGDVLKKVSANGGAVIVGSKLGGALNPFSLSAPRISIDDGGLAEGFVGYKEVNIKLPPIHFFGEGANEPFGWSMDIATTEVLRWGSNRACPSGLHEPK